MRRLGCGEGIAKAVDVASAVAKRAYALLTDHPSTVMKAAISRGIAHHRVSGYIQVIFVKTNMTPPKDPRLASMDTVFKALADPTRLRILALLAAGEVCVCNIHETLGIPQPRASRHLSYLRRANLVKTRKDGLWVHYQLAPLDDKVTRALMDAVAHCLSHVEACCRDGERLEKKTGRAAPEPAEQPSFNCCRPPRRTTLADRRGTRDRRTTQRS